MQRLLFDQFAGRMMAICRRYCRDRMEAEDMLQEGFIKAFSRIDQLKEGSLEGWLRRIFVNTCLSNWKKNKQIFAENSEESLSVGTLDENGLQQMETRELLDLIETLPQGARMIFNLYAIEGFDHGEIASTLGISESASRAQLTRARQLLKTKLSNHI